MMEIAGKTIRVHRWIHAGPCVVRVEVDAIIPTDDPSEPCLTPSALRYLDELQSLADAGAIEELEKHGEVYVKRSA